MNIKLLEQFQQRVDGTIRSRGAKMVASKAVEIKNEAGDKVIFKVKSDTQYNTEYLVSITEKSGKIVTVCNCPYSEGGTQVCKHISASAAFLIIRKSLSIHATAVQAISYNSGLVMLPYAPITQGFVEENSNAHNKSAVKNFVENIRQRHFIVRESWKGHVKCEVGDNNYWNKNTITIDIELGSKLKLTCTCKQTLAALCEHKHAALFILSEQYDEPDFLLTMPTRAELISDSLKPYGFDTADPDLDKYFAFTLDSKGKYVATPKDSSILKLSSQKTSFVEMIKRSSTAFLGSENSVDEKVKSDLSFGYVFHASIGNEGDIARPEIEILCGTLGKDGTFSKNVATRAETIERGRLLPTQTENQDEIENLLVSFQSKNLNKLLKKNENNPNAISLVNQHVFDVFGKLLPALKQELLYFTDSSYFSKSDLVVVKISDDRPEIRFSAYIKDVFFCLEAHFFIGDMPLKKGDLDNYYYHFLEKDSKLYFLDSEEKANHFNYFINNPIQKVHHSDEANFLRDLIMPLSKRYEIDMKKLSKPIKKQAATGFKPSVYLSEQGSFLLIRPVAEYVEGQVDLFSDELLFQNINEAYYLEIERDSLAELEVKTLLLGTHPDFNHQEDRGFLFVHFDKLMEHDWYFRFFELLKEAQIPVYGLDKIQKAKYSPYKASVKTRISSGINWFDVDVEMSFGDQTISLRDVQKAILKKEDYIKLDDGTLGLLPEEWVKKFAHVLRSADVDKKGNLKLSKFHFTLLEGLEEDNESKIQLEITEKKSRLLNFEQIQKHPLPEGITATLRPYQQAGYDWLMFLDEFGWGGCLADDMGLGKTLQMITFLKRQTELHLGVPNLVVLPTTLLFNWQRELDKFAPTLTYLNYSGTQRSKDHEQFADYNIVLTTYGLVANDIELFRNVTFNYVVLDESQAIKNPESQRYKAVSLLKSRNKAVMTGTPVENNMFDLYAQMTFANPGLLGNITHFQNHFSNPIDKNADVEAANTLRKLIAPFMLRRTKEQVAKDLPMKTEDILFCEMGAAQRKVYNAFRDNFRQMVGKSIDKDGLGNSSMMVLDALLKLRQICNSPNLLNTKEDYGNDSVKTEELVRHLTEKTGNHKVLVFSQFTSMLGLVEAELKKTNLSYEYLDGQTPSKKREEKVKRFQSDPSVRVFLISLKAGGVGLNLTEADYVYLIDPWWNPAVEAQAIDRTHRIGQTKKVFAYRMICKDTIEEKVLQLQERKRKMAHDIISTEAAFYKQLDKADILDLFS